MNIDNLDPVEVLAKRVKSCIENKNGEDLIQTLPAAETYLSERKELLFDAFFEAGKFKQNGLDYDNSIQYFNKARKYNPTTVIVFDKVIESVLAFYSRNKTKFIKGDLLKLLPAIKMFTEYYDNLAASNQSQHMAEDLIFRIVYRINYIAQDTIEGPMTHRVNIIVNALEKDVPMEQVKKEVTKFISDLIKQKNITRKKSVNSQRENNRTKGGK